MKVALLGILLGQVGKFPTLGQSACPPFPTAPLGAGERQGDAVGRPNENSRWDKFCWEMGQNLLGQNAQPKGTA